MTTTPKDFLTTAEAAREIGKHIETIRRYIRTGKLRTVRLSHKTQLIRRSEWERFLQEHETGKDTD